MFVCWTVLPLPVFCASAKGGLLSFPTPSTPLMTPVQTHDVVIVGAGLSGLAAAHALLTSVPGLRVVVLEARDRVGGRTLSVAVGDDGIDLGGAWIGPNQPRVLHLVEQLELKIIRQIWFDDPAQTSATTAPAAVPLAGPTATLLPTASQQPLPSLNSGSSSLSDSDAAELLALMLQLDAMASTVLGPPWLQCPDAGDWDKLSARQWLSANVQSEAVMREMVLFVETVLSCEPEQVSFLYFLYYVHMSGGTAQLADGDGGAQTWRLQGGTQQMSLGLARQVEELGGRVTLSAPVRHIRTNPISGGEAEEEGGAWAEAAAELQAGWAEWWSQRGQRWGQALAQAAAAGPGEGAEPVTTASECIGVQLEGGALLLARHVVLALPPPVWYKTIRFQPPLPEAKQKLGSSMFMGCAVKCIMLFTEALWQRPGAAAAGKLESFGPIANLFPTSVAGQPGLVGIVTAARAQGFVQLGEAEQRERVLAQLCAYFRLSRAEVEAALQRYEVYSFTGQEFSQGCFTALMPPGLATSHGDTLRLPLGRLHFAGSETARHCCGYFEGALEAGARVAEEVLQQLSRDML